MTWPGSCPSRVELAGQESRYVGEAVEVLGPPDWLRVEVCPWDDRLEIEPGIEVWEYASWGSRFVLSSSNYVRIVCVDTKTDTVRSKFAERNYNFLD